MKINKQTKINIIGDIMLDKWIHGSYGNYSAEAIIKIFKQENFRYTLGGVGNLSKNLNNLNIKFKLFIDLSNDYNSKIIKKNLNLSKINYFVIGKRKKTTTKTRYFINDHQIFRDDNEVLKNAKIDKSFLSRINRNDIVIISDYKKGVVYKNLHSDLMRKNCITFVDPKNEPNFYKNAFLVKPNLKKFEEWCGKFTKLRAFDLLKEMNWNWLIITCGNKGVHVFGKNNLYNFYNIQKVKNPNVVGAGDIFFAGLIHMMLKGNDVFTSAELASYASSKLVRVSYDRLLKNKDFKKKLVFTNGVFDILHKGHIQLLKYANKIGDKLIVGINSDKSVKLNKGSGRPYNVLQKRVKNLKKLKLIDKIIVFNEKTPKYLIKKIQPDVIIKGSDYKFKNVAGKEYSNVILFKKKNNLSSTKFIQKLN